MHVHGIQIHKDSHPYLSFESEYCAKEKFMIHQYIALHAQELAVFETCNAIHH